MTHWVVTIDWDFFAGWVSCLLFVWVWGLAKFRHKHKDEEK